MTQVRAPNGDVINFPDGMSDADITAVMGREYGGAPAPLTGLARALEPATSYPAALGKMYSEGAEQYAKGLGQIGAGAQAAVKPEPVPDTSPEWLRKPSIWGTPQSGEGLTELYKGIGNTALGGLGAMFSPVSAGLQTVVEKPVGEVTGSPAIGQAAGIAASFLLPGGGITRLPKAAPKPVAPTVAELKTSASAGYKSPEVTAVEIAPEALPTLSQKIKTNLNAAGIDENVAPQVFGILDKAEKMPGAKPDATALVTVANLRSLRETLSNTYNPLLGKQNLAASKAIGEIDDFLANLPKGETLAGNPQRASEVLAEANANYSAAARAGTLDKKVAAAELRAAASNSGMNVPNTLRQRVADILIKPELQRGYSQEQLEHMQRIVEGTTTRNSMRIVGNALGGGGGIGAAVTGFATLGVAPAVGVVLRKLEGVLTMRDIEKLSGAIRSDSPLGKSMESWSKYAQAAETKPATPRILSMLAIQSRNLSNNLKDFGITVSPNDLMRTLPGGAAGRAEDEQQ